MNVNMSNVSCDKVKSINDLTKKAQQLRLRRFGMSVATYAVALLATYLITLLGIGDLNVTQWTTLIGLCLFGISVFLVLFSTRVNLRFSEQSLTQEQIIYSFFYACLVMYWLPDARPIILLFFLPPFSFGVLSLTLRQYLVVVACVLGLYAALLGLEYLQGRQGFILKYQLFLFILFGILLTWFAFFGGFVSNLRLRLRLQKEELKIEIEERKIAQIEKEKLIVELKDALREVKTLGGLLPICAACKKIRDDQGYWNQIESYIKSRSDAEFTHSICPDCAKKLYPDIDIQYYNPNSGTAR
ncbi:MAG: hypothetical protein ABIL58_22600 [Pseudomonadota bacterium]